VTALTAIHLLVWARAPCGRDLEKACPLSLTIEEKSSRLGAARFSFCIRPRHQGRAGMKLDIAASTVRNDSWQRGTRTIACEACASYRLRTQHRRNRARFSNTSTASRIRFVRKNMRVSRRSAGDACDRIQKRAEANPPRRISAVYNFRRNGVVVLLLVSEYWARRPIRNLPYRCLHSDRSENTNGGSEKGHCTDWLTGA
jgi:hypothetical protein